jgi:hypothetical protein
MRPKLLACALIAAVLASPRAALAFCGFYVGSAEVRAEGAADGPLRSWGGTSRGAQLTNDATMVVLMREGQRTVLSMQNDYQGPPENFALVVPVPVILQKENVKTLPREIFRRVDDLAAPRLVEYWEQDPCAPLPSPSMPGAKPMFASQAAGNAANLGVKIEAQFTVAEFEIVVLSAQDSTGLDAWLRRQRFAIPDGAEAYLRPYVLAGSKFFVARVDVSKVSFEERGGKKVAMLSPLRFHYDADAFSLPIRLGLMSSAGTQDLVVHILAKGKRYEVANYPNIAIPTNLDVDDKTRDAFGAFYAALFDRTLEKTAKAVVTEYAWDAAGCDPCPTPALSAAELMTLGADVLASTQPPPAPGAPGPAPPLSRIPAAKPSAQGAPVPRAFTPPTGFVLTRLHARYGKDSLGEDLVFREAPPLAGGRASSTAALASVGGREGGASTAINNFQARYAIRHPWEGAMACSNPHRGIWGAPPGGGAIAPSPKPARDLAFAPRGVLDLAAFVKTAVPEIDLAPRAPGADAPPARATESEPPRSSAPPPTQAPVSRGCGGCNVAGSPVPFAIATAISLLWLTFRRRRW